MKLKVFIFLLILLTAHYAQSAVVYIAALQNKHDPKKFIITVADIHELTPQIENDQIIAIKKLLANIANRKLPIDLLFECSDLNVKTVDPSIVPLNVLHFITSLYVQEQLQLFSHPVACDIRNPAANPVEAWLNWLFQQIFPMTFPAGHYHNFKELKRLVSEIFTKN